MPEQSRQALEDFLDYEETNAEETFRASDPESGMMMLAKGMALQQAGVIPLYTDLTWMIESARATITLEGLLRGH